MQLWTNEFVQLKRGQRRLSRMHDIDQIHSQGDESLNRRFVASSRKLQRQNEMERTRRRWLLPDSYDTSDIDTRKENKRELTPLVTQPGSWPFRQLLVLPASPSAYH